MNDSLTKKFIKKVKIESSYKKIVNKDIIANLDNAFSLEINKKEYPNNINNCLELSLEFYKNYDENYYDIILDGINKGKIIILDKNKKSLVDTQTNNVYIKLSGNDSDVFMLVHEFAHYIDRSSNPLIVPNEFWFLSETFSFYIEKKLEQWLDNTKYHDLIVARINNRIFYEKKMLNAIKIKMYYENLYKEKGKLLESDININDAKLVGKYNVPNTINYLLQYPLANIISNHLIDSDIPIEGDFAKTCLDIDLYQAIGKFADTTKSKKLKNNYVSYNGCLQINKSDIVNQYGESLLLKGISTHGIQWFKDLYTLDNISKLKEIFDINLIRIAMYTEQDGYINNPILKNKVIEIVKYAIELDLYVIIDWHILNDNDPNTNKEQAKEFFKEMSKKFKHTPNVLYEICNEPNGSVTWDDVKSYANEIIHIIRNNTKNIIIVGTPNWCQDIDKVADDKLNYDNIAYSLHFYSGSHNEELRKKIDYARSKNICVFVSEFGISKASGTGGVFKKEGKIWLDYLKERNISFVNWSLTNKDESSALLLPNTKVIDESNLSASGKFIKEEYNK